MDPFQPEPGPASAAVRSQVQGPAILLLVTGGLGDLLAVFSLIRHATKSLILPPNLADNPQMVEALTSLQRFGGITAIFALITSGIVVVGAAKMLTLKTYPLAIAAAIIAMIPCLGPCCCLGIPAGIWALVVLNKPEVRAAFTA